MPIHRPFYCTIICLLFGLQTAWVTAQSTCEGSIVLPLVEAFICQETSPCYTLDFGVEYEIYIVNGDTTPTPIIFCEETAVVVEVIDSTGDCGVVDVVVHSQPEYYNQSNTICPGDSSYFFGKYYYYPGTYLDTLYHSETHCPSTIGVFTLTEIPPILISIDSTVCPNDIILWSLDGTTLTPGTHEKILPSSDPSQFCDTIVTITIIEFSLPVHTNQISTHNIACRFRIEVIV